VLCYDNSALTASQSAIQEALKRNVEEQKEPVRRNTVQKKSIDSPKIVNSHKSPASKGGSSFLSDFVKRDSERKEPCLPKTAVVGKTINGQASAVKSLEKLCLQSPELKAK